MTNIVFMGTPDFAVPALQTLIEEFNVVGVVTQPDRPAGRGKKLKPSPVKVVAQEAGLPIYQPKSLRKKALADPIRAWNPDLIIVAAFGQILRPHLLELPPLGCVNIHASLLPRWRGASPIQHAILSGDTHTGVTLMQMDVGLDTGDMLVADSLPIAPDETAQSLHDKLAQLGATMTRAYLPHLLAGDLTATPQNEDEATYAGMIGKDDGRLDFNQPAVQLDRQMRAMTPWPSAFTTWEGTTLKIVHATPFLGSLPQGENGQVVTAGENIVVLTSSGGLLLQTIQLAGKRKMAVEDFVNGRPEFMGAILGG